MNSINRYLQEDLVTAKKIKEDPNYYNKLSIADEHIKTLNIKSNLQFYAYAQVLNELENIPYSDIQAFQRFKNNEYYEYVQSYLPPDIKRIK